MNVSSLMDTLQGDTHTMEEMSNVHLSWDVIGEDTVDESPKNISTREHLHDDNREWLAVQLVSHEPIGCVIKQ
jgi:hypothetical protein